VLIATHDLRQVERLGVRTIHLKNGEIVEQMAEPIDEIGLETESHAPEHD